MASNQSTVAMIKKVIFIIGSIVIFLIGCVIYGMFLNYSQKSLGEQLKEKNIKSVNTPIIKIERSKYTLSLYQDTVLLKEYRAVFGRLSNSNSSRQFNNRVTPAGDYRICKIDSNNVYHRFLYINYPNDHDIAEAYRQNLISRDEYENLRYTFFYKETPDPNSVLGGKLGIHGIGQLNSVFKNLPFVFNWTDGSVAISDEDIDELFEVVKIGTPVYIY